MDSKSILVFLNTPVLSTGDDIIGVETHVKKLSAAIDSGTQVCHGNTKLCTTRKTRLP